MSEGIHISTEDLAVLVDGWTNDPDRRRIHEHLVSCNRCASAYQDSLRYRAMSSTDPGSFKSNEQLQRVANGVARGTSARQRINSGVKRPMTAGLIIAMIALLTVTTWWATNRDRTRPASIEGVVTALGHASSQTLVVIPGAEGVVRSGGPTYRSGFTAMSAELQSTFDELARSYRNDPSVETARWLAAGYVATGQIQHAQTYLTDASRAYPDDAALMNLQALVYYFQGELVSARDVLSQALALHPDHSLTRLNLAIVLLEQDDVSRAREMLRQIAARRSDDPIGRRAAWVLKQN
jgi:hypothetical protein